MSIPKIIHYCWFGPNPIPKNEQIYIENWQVKLPEYRFVFWNEESFDVQSVRYVKQAYDQGKYAFVSDYVRIYALNKYGGIYLDTDVEVLKDFSPFLDHNTFLGFENRTMVGTGIIGTQKK
ncbi:glycosyltransferase family 32 protein [Sellimonas intestinalis]|uniref:glycosyltransferase family 32 protein n=1 Tax=Sellimonas intestinalis TaxID=1653434 RepID=UPI0039908BFF